MNIILTIILVLAVLITGILIAALFMQKIFTVERQLTINARREDVFNFIKFLRNHVTFSKWTTKEQSLRVPGTGIDGTPGYILPWNNYKEKAGIGELEIKKVIEGEAILIEHRYFKPVKGVANSILATIEDKDDEVIVKWVYSGISKYPLNFLTGILNMDKIVGRDLDNALSILKMIMENESQYKNLVNETA